MAIYPKLRGLEVKIKVDGKVAKEYEEPMIEEQDLGDISLVGRRALFGGPDVQQNDHMIVPEVKTTAAEKYIESKPGVDFAVQMCLRSDFPYLKNDLKFAIDVDGLISESEISIRAHHAKGRYIVIDGIKSGSGDNIVKNKFVFSNLELDRTEPNLLSSHAKALVEECKRLGQITIKVYRVEVYKQNLNAASLTFGDAAEVNADSIPEKILKKAHPGKSLSQRTDPVTPPAIFEEWFQVHSRPIDSDDEPIAYFVFKYRSMEDLHKELIVPRPDDLESIPVKQLTRQQMVRLIERQKEDSEKQEAMNRRIAHNTEEKHKRQLAERASFHAAIKRELSEDADDSDVVDSNESSKRRCFIKIEKETEVVDLTEE
ncbi:hypothetical protein FKW77_007166 [Venturia effusa]|uniref:DUF7918 domain-containing protein n=1 Tax=Venturia effusa TaxID=50376 RepID=A0A517KWR0_9PEZI|nr:hypothetical protein FKW77_007166 [Venturia effusa]